MGFPKLCLHIKPILVQTPSLNCGVVRDFLFLVLVLMYQILCGFSKVLLGLIVYLITSGGTQILHAGVGQLLLD